MGMAGKLGKRFVVSRPGSVVCSVPDFAIQGPLEIALLRTFAVTVNRLLALLVGKV